MPLAVWLVMLFGAIAIYMMYEAIVSAKAGHGARAALAFIAAVIATMTYLETMSALPGL